MDIWDNDYVMGIPFDVDAEMERAWARMDETTTTEEGDDDDED